MGQVGNASGPALCLVVFRSVFFSSSSVRRNVPVNFIAAALSLELTGVYFWH
jgi:hypothetical protein